MQLLRVISKETNFLNHKITSWYQMHLKFSFITKKKLSLFLGIKIFFEAKENPLKTKSREERKL